MSCASAERPGEPPLGAPDAVGVEAEPPQPVERLAFAGGGVLGAQHGSPSTGSDPPALTQAAPRRGNWLPDVVDCRAPGPPRVGAVGDRPTIYDVAREAGRRCVHGLAGLRPPGRVNAETARAIFAAAERIGYRTEPRSPASLGRQTGAVALMVSDITNPFYGEIIKGAEEAVRQAGYALLLSDTSETGPVEREVVERTLDLVEGIVLASSRMSDSAIRMIAKQKPLVLLNRQITETSVHRHGQPARHAAGRRAPRHARPRHDHLPRGPGGQLGGGHALAGAAGGGARAGAAGAPRRPARRPDHAHRPRRRAPDRRRGRDGRARLQRRARDRRHQGPQAARRGGARRRERRRVRQRAARRRRGPRR